LSYYVVDPSGQKYGPADLPLLQQWVREGRIVPTTSVFEEASGQTMVASSMPALYPPIGMQAPTLGAPGVYYPPPNQGRGQLPDVNLAWGFAVASILVVPCCGIVSIAFGAMGILFAKKAQAQGFGTTQAPLIISIVGICIGLLVTFLPLVGGI
jgi:hypothetical protein